MKRSINLLEKSVPFSENETNAAILTKITRRSRPALALLDTNCCEPKSPKLNLSDTPLPSKRLVTLPKEILHQIFDELNGHDLAVVSLCSRQLCSLVFSYSSNWNVRRRIFPLNFRHSTLNVINPFGLANGPYLMENNSAADTVLADVNYSLLALFATMNKSGTERAQIFVRWLGELLCSAPPPIGRSLSMPSIRRTCLCFDSCIGLFASGAFLYMVTARHKDRPAGEWLPLMYQQLNAAFNLENTISRILSYPQGTQPLSEFYLRVFLIRLFILPGMNNADEAWSAFWLGCFLRPLCYFDRAKLLVLLSAPFNSRTLQIDWTFLSKDRQAPPNHQSILAEFPFKDLGELLRLMLVEKVVSEAELNSIFGYLLRVDTSANRAESLADDAFVEAFILSYAGPQVAETILQWTLNPSRQSSVSANSVRLNHVVDTLFYMVGIAFETRHTSKFAEVLNLIRSLSSPTECGDDFATKAAFRLGHRLAIELCLEGSDFRRQVGELRGDLLGFVGHLFSIMFQRIALSQ